MPVKYLDIYEQGECKCGKIHGICNCGNLPTYGQSFYQNQYPSTIVHKMAEKPLESSCCNNDELSVPKPSLVPIYMRASSAKFYPSAIITPTAERNTAFKGSFAKRTENRDNMSRYRVKILPTVRSELEQHSSCIGDIPLQQKSMSQGIYEQKSRTPFNVESGYKNVRYQGSRANKEVLAGQFPDPFLPVSTGVVNDHEMWETRFRRWWEATRREEQIRNLKSTERLSEQSAIISPTQPIVKPSYKEDVKKSKYSFKFGKLIKAILCDYKSSDESREADVLKRHCECGKIDICGPQKKCAGYEGTIEPCGENCACGESRECMDQHMELICPCKPCYCPTDQHIQSQYALYNRQIRADSSKPFVVSSQLRDGMDEQQYYPNYSSKPFVWSSPSVKSVKDQHCCSDSSDDSFLPPTNVHSTNAQGSFVSYKNVVEQGDCCCVCDEAVCPCSCCLPEPKNNCMQTSRCNLKECCTQTDKIQGKCCRCCRCCREKCNCMKKTSDDNDGDLISIKDNHFLEPSNTNRINKQSQVNQQMHYKQPKGSQVQHDKQNQIAPSAVMFGNQCSLQQPKTLMVRSDSAQCIPETQNKETSCSYDHPYSSSKMNQFIQLLYSKNYDTSKYLHNEGDWVRNKETETPIPTVQFDHNDLKAITNAKLKTLFIEDGFYSSPLSGRNYDLTTNTLDVKTKFLDRNLPKLIDINDQLTDSKYPHQNLTKMTDFEHKKLITAVCETILSNGENSQKASSIDLNLTDPGNSVNADGFNSNRENTFAHDLLESKFSKRFEILEEKIDDLLKTRKLTPVVNDPDTSLKDIPLVKKSNDEKMESDTLSPSVKKVNATTATNTLPRNVKNEKKIFKFSNFVPPVVPVTRTGLVAAIPNKYNSQNNSNKDTLTKFRTTTRSSSLDSRDRCKTQIERQIDDRTDTLGDVVKCGNQPTVNKDMRNLLTQIENIHNTLSVLNLGNENDSDSENVLGKNATFDAIETIKTETSNLFSRLTKNHLSAVTGKNEDSELVNNEDETPFDRAEEETKGNVVNYPKIELKHLDFSSIKFSKTFTDNDKQNCPIGGNLPSITSSISDTYSLRKIFSNDNCELIENTSSPLLPELNPSFVKK